MSDGTRTESLATSLLRDPDGSAAEKSLGAWKARSAARGLIREP